LLLLHTGLSLLPPLFQREIVDRVIVAGDLGRLGVMVAGLIGVYALLCRFYDPIHGRILVDGRDLRHVQVKSLRQHVAVVLQDTFLFNALEEGRIREVGDQRATGPRRAVQPALPAAVGAGGE
jgi:ABC-type bacteriocin/lantibiotic exporter with double-glycine peptidase domain